MNRARTALSWRALGRAALRLGCGWALVVAGAATAGEGASAPAGAAGRGSPGAVAVAPVPTARLGLTWEAERTVDVTLPNGTPDGRTRAVLTLTNLGDAPLPASGWSLYVHCMSGIDASFSEGGLSPAPGGIATLYRLRPNEHMPVLQPGESHRFVLRHLEVVSAISKAPTGPYWVPDDDPSRARSLVRYEAMVPTLPTQVGKDASGAAPWPTPESRYEQYGRALWVEDAQLPPFLPSPAHYQPGSGTLVWSAMPQILSQPGLEPEIALARSILAPYVPAEDSEVAPLPAALRLDLGPVAGEDAPEAYELTVDPVSGVSVRGASAAAVSRALQSLRQMIRPGPQGRGLEIPAGFVRDAPRFAVRGFMMDIARNFRDKDAILGVLDLMARYKINVLHLHLADDEGWRLEIAGLPELTEIGARRAHDGDPLRALPPMFGSGPDGTDPNGSGYLREADYIEILRRAQALHIEVIPEVEMPGHSRAAVVSMKARSARIRARGGAGADDFALADPADRSVYRSPQLYSDNAMDPGLESTYRFIDHVVGAIVQLHHRAGVPLRTIHVGGDELPRGAWMGSPASLARMKRMGFATREQLWDDFYARVQGILVRHGLALSGWEELGTHPESAQAGARQVANPRFVTPSTRLTVWNNLEDQRDLAHRLANAGYGVVLAPVTNLYLDLINDRDPAEPGHDWAGTISLQDSFDLRPFDLLRPKAGDAPVSAGFEPLTESGRAHILGLEATLFSETVRDPARLSYMLLPRLFALSERAWVREPAWERADDAAARAAHDADWSRFANQLARRVLPQLDRELPGLAYRIAPPGLHREGGQVLARAELPGMTLRYTTDGSEPTAASAEVRGPIADRVLVRVAAFSRQGRAGRSSMMDNREPATTTPIRHLIVVVGENRSFDNVFGTWEPASHARVANLLSRGIVDREGRPGPAFELARQRNPDRPQAWAPERSGPAAAFYGTLPKPYTRGVSGGPAVPDERFPADLPDGPFPITAHAPWGTPSGNPVHRFFQMWQQVDGGRKDLFVWVAQQAGIGSSNGPDAKEAPGATFQGGVAMGFFRMSQGDAPYLRSLADEFSISDNYHQPVMGGTTANFLALATGHMASYVDAQGRPATPPRDLIENPDPRPGTLDWYTEDGYDGGSYVACADRAQAGVAALRDWLDRLPYRPWRDGNCEPGAYYLVNNLDPAYNMAGEQVGPGPRQRLLPPQLLPHIGDALSRAGVSWKWYAQGMGDATHPQHDFCATCVPVTTFASTMTGGDRARLQDLERFFTDVDSAGGGADGALPSVSFLVPDDDESGHPGDSVLPAYERFVQRIVDAVRARPALWRSSAILVTFDEGGGYYDSGYIQPIDFFGDGTRIPMIAVSPWARHGHVDHVYADHVSILKFIEHNWGLAPLSGRSRDNLPNPLPDPADPYVPANRPAIGDLTTLFAFPEKVK